jgi:hypothetical protein
VLAHWNNSPRIVMSPLSDTLSWFLANQSSLFLRNVSCLAEKQQIPILLSLVWPDRGSNTQFTALVSSTLTINLHRRGCSNILALSVPDEGYSRNGSCTLNLIFHFYVMFTGLGYEDMETLPNGLTLITSVSRFFFWPIKSVCFGKSYYFSVKVKMYQLYLWTHQKAFVGATRSY